MALGSDDRGAARGRYLAVAHSGYAHALCPARSARPDQRDTGGRRLAVAVVRHPRRHAVRAEDAVDTGAQHGVSSRRGRSRAADGLSDRASHRAGRHCLAQHRGPRLPVLHVAAPARGRAHRRVRLARPHPLLPVLGGRARPDVLPHQHLGRRQPLVRGVEVLHLHAGGQSRDARRHHRPVPRHGRQDLRHARDCEAVVGLASRGADRDLRGHRHRACRQGAHLPAPHLASGCARRSADGRFRAAGGRAAEDGFVRLHAPGPDAPA